MSESIVIHGSAPQTLTIKVSKFSKLDIDGRIHLPLCYEDGSFTIQLLHQMIIATRHADEIAKKCNVTF